MKHRLPAGWSWRSLNEVVGPPQYGLSLSATANGNVAMIGMKDMADGRISDGLRTRVQATEKEIEGCTLNKGDLLLNRTNSPDLVGKLAVWDRDEVAVFASYLVRYPAIEQNAFPRFTIAALSTNRSIQQIDRLITRAISQANINPSAFYDEVEIAVPNTEIQKRIVSILDAWDQAIDRTEKLNTAKRKRYRALLEKLVANAFSEEASSLWAPAKLGDVFTEREERSAELPLLSITGRGGVVPRDDLDRRQTASEDKSKYKVIRPGDIGFNTMRMWQGVFGRSEHTGIVSPAYTVVTAIEGKVDPVFASHLFGHVRAINLFHRYSQGLVDDTLMLKFPHFAEIAMRFPPFELQRKIGQLLETEEAGLRPEEMRLAALQMQKRGLMQKLLTGEWQLGEQFQ